MTSLNDDVINIETPDPPFFVSSDSEHDKEQSCQVLGQLDKNQRFYEGGAQQAPPQLYMKQKRPAFVGLRF